MPTGLCTASPSHRPLPCSSLQGGVIPSHPGTGLCRGVCFPDRFSSVENPPESRSGLVKISVSGLVFGPGHLALSRPAPKQRDIIRGKPPRWEDHPLSGRLALLTWPLPAPSCCVLGPHLPSASPELTVFVPALSAGWSFLVLPTPATGSWLLSSQGTQLAGLACICSFSVAGFLFFLETVLSVWDSTG